MKPGTRSLLGLAALAAAVWAAQGAWQHFGDAALGRELARAAQPGDIRMLSSRSCVYCDAARQWLTQHGVAHSECFIESDADCAALYNAANAPGTPVMLVRGQPQLGFSAQRLRQSLSRS